MIAEIADLSEQSYIDKFSAQIWESLNMACLTSDLVRCTNLCNVPCEKAKHIIEILVYYYMKQVARWN